MPEDRGLVMASVTTDCCLNSNKQPVVMETMVFVWSLMLVIILVDRLLSDIPSLLSGSTSTQVFCLRVTES